MRRNWPSQGGQPRQKALPEQRPGGVNTHGTFRNIQQSSGEEKQARKGKLFIVKLPGMLAVLRNLNFIPWVAGTQEG